MAQPWYERPFVLALGGTLAVHVLIAVGGDALVVTHPYIPDKDPPHVELVDIDLPTPPPPPPPPTAAPPEPPAPAPAPVVAKVVRTAPRTRATTPPTAETPPPPPTSTPASPEGGGPVVAMDNLGPDATGHVPVAVGHPSAGHIGRGGTGTGAGSGSGAGDVAVPVSVATIKKRALPRGDYGYIDAGREYPPEAKQLGIEGPVRVRLVVNDKGAVTGATLLPPGLGHGLDDLALRKAKEIQFEPARDTEDRPVASVVVWTFNMTLPK